MPHHFKAMLDEYKFAIDHLVPTVPAEVAEEAKRMYKELLANQDATEEQIRAALVQTGRGEFAARRAYHALMDATVEEKTKLFVLEHLDPAVRGKVEKIVASGVSLASIMQSDLFEKEFTPEERYQFEHGFLDAQTHVKEEMDPVALAEDPAYKKKLAEEEQNLAAIEEAINALEALATQEPTIRTEALERVKTFREGLSVTERDPELADVKNEVEYWKGVLAEGKDA
ncbi:hypothetical protein HYV73_00320 [Candidatus Uhrbacteria bacterium]|nr:hypothetical protein [Candidatus Uhrbacteria bacterium]